MKGLQAAEDSSSAVHILFMHLNHPGLAMQSFCSKSCNPQRESYLHLHAGTYRRLILEEKETLHPTEILHNLRTAPAAQDSQPGAVRRLCKISVGWSVSFSSKMRFCIT